MLDGKKTYLVSLMSILGTLTAALTGQISWPDAAQIVTTAVLASTMRNGIKTDVKPPAK